VYRACYAVRSIEVEFANSKGRRGDKGVESDVS
jgi:hypothetical protein